MREVSRGICASEGDSRSRRRTAAKAIMARTGPVKKRAIAISTRNPIRVGTARLEHSVQARTTQFGVGNRFLFGKGPHRKLGKNVAFASFRVPIYMPQPVRSDRLFHRAYSEVGKNPTRNA